MYTVFDYIYWRGDLPFAQEPFNEVDSVVLSMICYADFGGIVPTADESGYITLSEAMKQFNCPPTKDKKLGIILPADIVGMVYAAAEAPRYRDIKLFAYENTVDEEKEMQFGAMSFRLPDDSLFVAYRGTDDTIVGWKEDFNMAFMSHVPAQERAAEYLNEIAKVHGGPIRVAGHSKGGNLAIWAAVNSDAVIRARILQVYSNDGPGFTEELIQSEAYQSMRDRCMTYVPQSSIVGMLMEHDEHYQLIYSNRNGLMQHDPYSWGVERNHYKYVDARSAFGEYSDNTMRIWLDSMSRDERKTLVTDVFEVLESTGAKTLTELLETKGAVKTALKTLMEYEKPRRKRIAKMLSRFFAAQVESVVPENDFLDKLSRIEKSGRISLPDWFESQNS